jgi:hypothetical protein
LTCIDVTSAQNECLFASRGWADLFVAWGGGWGMSPVAGGAGFPRSRVWPSPRRTFRSFVLAALRALHLDLPLRRRRSGSDRGMPSLVLCTDTALYLCSHRSRGWGHHLCPQGLGGLIYSAARQTRIRVWAAMVAAVLVSRPQKVCAPWRARPQPRRWRSRRATGR